MCDGLKTEKILAFKADFNELGFFLAQEQVLNTKNLSQAALKIQAHRL